MFFHTPIDTYGKYNALVALIMMHVIITDILSDSLTPNLLNVVQNRHIQFIPHPKRVYFTITTIWSVYCQVPAAIPKTTLFSLPAASSPEDKRHASAKPHTHGS